MKGIIHISTPHQSGVLAHSLYWDARQQLGAGAFEAFSEDIAHGPVAGHTPLGSRISLDHIAWMKHSRRRWITPSSSSIGASLLLVAFPVVHFLSFVGRFPSNRRRPSWFLTSPRVTVGSISTMLTDLTAACWVSPDVFEVNVCFCLGLLMLKLCQVGIVGFMKRW
jgi:hypothetical protein